MARPVKRLDKAWKPLTGPAPQGFALKLTPGLLFHKKQVFLAMTYSPAPSPGKYHRRWRA